MTIYEQLERDEGFRPKLYKDTEGHLTIGIGWNLEAEPISHEIARLALEEQVAKRITQLRQALPWADRLSEPRYGVLVNMAFNMGIAGLLGFKTMLAHLQAGEYNKAADAMLDSKWARQVGLRAVRLAQQMIENEWV